MWSRARVAVGHTSTTVSGEAVGRSLYTFNYLNSTQFKQFSNFFSEHNPIEHGGNSSCTFDYRN